MPHRATNAFITSTLFLDKLLVTISYTVSYVFGQSQVQKLAHEKSLILSAQQSKTPKIFNWQETKREKQQVLMFERLEPVNIWLISVINDTNDHFLVKIVVDILRPASAICDILCRIQTTELDQAYMINTMILAKRNQECGLVTQTSFLLLRPPTAAPTRLRQKEPR